MSDPINKFHKEIHPHLEKMIKTIKKHDMTSFTYLLTDISGNIYEFTVKKVKEEGK